MHFSTSFPPCFILWVTRHPAIWNCFSHSSQCAPPCTLAICATHSVSGQRSARWAPTQVNSPPANVLLQVSHCSNHSSATEPTTTSHFSLWTQHAAPSLLCILPCPPSWSLILLIPPNNYFVPSLLSNECRRFQFITIYAKTPGLHTSHLCR